MLLSKKTTVQLNKDASNIAGHLCYAAYKLWNVCNYERRSWTSASGLKYPDWYYQKSAHKDDHWFKSLPSQTAQEVCKLLDGAWRSFFKLKKTGGIENPKPPRYKHEPIPVTYMQNGMKRISERTLRLAIPKKLKEHMAEAYGIHEKYLVLENNVFRDMDTIKQVHLYPPENGVVRLIVVYEVPDAGFIPDNGHYLSIDMGTHNLMTCIDSLGCDSFIIGREYLSITRRFDKEIARVQSIWAEQQSSRGVEHSKPSKHVLQLYEKKRNCVKDYIHKMTHYIAEYCSAHHICAVVIGDLTGIRENNDMGARINQQFHSLPFAKIRELLRYKLALCGIHLFEVSEAYSSQCSPLSESVSRENATKKNRVKRGLYKDGSRVWNADSVGAFNILRIYLTSIGKTLPLATNGLSSPKVIKVAV